MDELLKIIPALILCSIPAIIHALLIKSRKGLLLKIIVTLAVFNIVDITLDFTAIYIDHQVFRACWNEDLEKLTCDNWIITVSDTFHQYNFFLAILLSLMLSIWFYKINRMKNNKNISS